MDVREKLVELSEQLRYCANVSDCENCKRWDKVCEQQCVDNLLLMAADLIDTVAHGATVQEWYSASNPPEEDGTYLVQTNTGTITTARFYAFKSFPATKYLPACHRSPSWQSNRNVVKWTFLPQPPKGE